MPIVSSLSPRLAAVLALTPTVAVAADIGTDHGLLPVAWVQSGRAERAIASDLRKGPLAQAARTVAAAGLDGCIELRQGDGLTVLAPGEADLACIAGVGGTVVQQMLAAAQPLPVRHLLLQPMNGWAGVRQQAARLGLRLRQEVMVAEGERLYLVLALEQGGETELQGNGAETQAGGSMASWSPPPGLSSAGQQAVWEAGPLLYARRDPLLRQWLDGRIAELQRRLGRIAAGRGAAAAARREAVTAQLVGLEELRQCW